MTGSVHPEAKCAAEEIVDLLLIAYAECRNIAHGERMAAAVDALSAAGYRIVRGDEPLAEVEALRAAIAEADELLFAPPTLDPWLQREWHKRRDAWRRVSTGSTE